MKLSELIDVMTESSSLVVETLDCGVIYEGFKYNFGVFKLGDMYYDYLERTVEAVGQCIDRWNDNAVYIRISSYGGNDMIYSYYDSDSCKIYFTFNDIDEGNRISEIVKDSSRYTPLPNLDFVCEIKMPFVGNVTAMCFIPSPYSISYESEYNVILYQLKRNGIIVQDSMD